MEEESIADIARTKLVIPLGIQAPNPSLKDRILAIVGGILAISFPLIIIYSWNFLINRLPDIVFVILGFILGLFSLVFTLVTIFLCCLALGVKLGMVEWKEKSNN